MRRRRTLAVIFTIYSIFALGQGTAFIEFDENKTLTNQDVKDAPVFLRDFVLNKINGVIVKKLLYFDSDNNYFKTKKIERQQDSDKKIKLSNNKEVFESKLKLNEKESKIIKNIQHNDYLIGLKQKPINLEKVKWKYFNESKNVLNYKCLKATTTFNNKPLIVFYTTEINGNATPYNYPFIKAVVLEYFYDKRHGIATKVEFNQPDIKDFFK